MASQGASLQNYNNELVKCEIRPRQQGASCVSEGADTVLAAGGEEEENRDSTIGGGVSPASVEAVRPLQPRGAPSLHTPGISPGMMLQAASAASLWLCSPAVFWAVRGFEKCGPWRGRG